jgi:hypothetical protein
MGAAAIYQKIFTRNPVSHCGNIAGFSTGGAWRTATRVYPQNVDISGYELQILKNIFVSSVNSYLT